jgi:CRP-like cAMP-binding protein
LREEKAYSPLSDIGEIRPILSKIAIFGGLNERQLGEIFRLLKTVFYNEGEYVCKQGEAPSHIYIIKTGAVKIVYDLEGVSLELAFFQTGDCFGETSVIGIQPHSSNAIAVKPSELIVLERQALLNIFETDKELFGMLILNIARETSRRLYKLDEALAKYFSAKKH